jgi:hypothetical protein
LALNKTFTCNSIIDESSNLINCWYQGYHVRTGKWNDVRYSDYNQYSCNLGDGDWLTQTGEVFNGDEVILVFWDSDENYRSGLKNRLCSILITIDSKSTYINDIQLKPKLGPKCGFILDYNKPTINNPIEAIDKSTDDTFYEYNNITHYQIREYSSELIFDSVGIENIKYDWDEGSGWGEDSIYYYASINDYNISQQVTNYYSLSAICTQPLRVKYNSPIPGLIFDYIDPIHTTEEVSVEAIIEDIDSRIYNIDHKVIIRNRDTLDLLEDNLISNSTWLSYKYDYTINILQKHFFTQVLYWNDGWDDLTIYYNNELPITNWCPDVTIIKEDQSTNTKKFIQTSTDKDGDVVKWLWKIYFIPPFSSGEYVEVYREEAQTSDDFTVGFTVGGSYKVEITVQDDYGCYSSDEIIFDILGECPESVSACISNIKFIFPKQLGHD